MAAGARTFTCVQRQCLSNFSCHKQLIMLPETTNCYDLGQASCHPTLSQTTGDFA